MKITILTLFPQVFTPLLNTSILKIARKQGLLITKLVDIRDYATDRHKTVDDKPYGGGTGMILRVDILYKALMDQENGYKILLSPKGKRYTQDYAKRLAGKKHLILICGHYEGVDSRFDSYVDEIISIGDYILTGGEIPAMIVTDSVTRLIPHVLPEGATTDESFEQGLLEYPQYTRPQVFRKKPVPEILLSGDHKKIAAWREAKRRKLS